MRALAGLLLLAAVPSAAVAPRYARPPGTVLGVAAETAPLAVPGGGWPEARLLRGDAATGEAWRVATVRGTNFAAAPAVMRTEIYLTRGSARIGGQAMAEGDLLVIDARGVIGRVTLDPMAELLLFRDPPSPRAPKSRRTFVQGQAVQWRAGTVARDAGAAAPLEIKPLWTDPVTGARIHLVRSAPGVAVPWEVHPVAEEGYLLEGDYHLAECLPDGRRDYDYGAGGYFYRPPGLLHSGPQSTTAHGSTWLIRTPGTLTAVFYPACPAAPAEESPLP